MEISTFFVNFRLDQIKNCSVQIKKMKDRIFSFQLKKSHTIKWVTEENSWKNRSNQYHVRYIAWLDWSKTAKDFSVNSCRKFLSWHKANRQASKWISPLRQIHFILFLVTSKMYVVLFILSKCLLDCYQLFSIFTCFFFC